MGWSRIRYRFHARAGLWLALPLLVLAITGMILVVDPEIDSLAHRKHVEESAGLTFFGVADAEVIIRENFTGWSLKGMYLPTPDDPRYRAELVSERSTATVFLSASDGEVIGIAEHPWRGTILSLHESFWLGGYGTALLTAIGGLLVLLSLAGLWVRRGAFKSLVRLPRFGRGWRLGFSDVHQSVGVASMVFLLVIGLSGAWLAAPAIGKLVDGGAKPPSIHKQERIRVASPLVMDDAAFIARGHLDGFEPRYVRFPDTRNGVIRVSGSVPGTSVYGPYASRVEIDVATGNVVASRDLRNVDRMTKLKCLAESLHYGSFGGAWVKWVYGLASVAFGLLCILGVMIWVSRRQQVNQEVL